MGISFWMGVLPVDERGEVVQEYVKEPNYSVPHTWLWELVDDPSRPFPDIVTGLDLAWFRSPSLQKCIEERRAPERGDCFDPAAIAADVTTILERLSHPPAPLPRLFRLWRSDRPNDPTSSARVFVDGRKFDLHAGWNRCGASHWSPEWEKRPSSERVMDLLHGRGPDVRIDLLERAALDCCASVDTADGQQPGPPLTIYIDSISCEDHFAQYLRPMLALCDDAIEHGYVVMTGRS